MRRRQRTAGSVVLAAVTVFWVLALAAPASAKVISGNCTGSATFTNGAVISESTPLSDVVVVPDGDTVAYQGSTNLAPPDEEVPMFGKVAASLPVGSWTVKGWNGDTKMGTDSGEYTYDVPGWVPRGAGAIQVTGSHTQQGQTCVATVMVALAGDPGIAALLSVVGALIFAVMTLAGGIKRKIPGARIKGRMFLGLLGGLLFGLFAAMSLFLYGLVNLNSIILILVPSAGVIIGIVLATTGPFGLGLKVAAVAAEAGGHPGPPDLPNGDLQD